MNTISLPRTSLWNLAEMDRDYAAAKLPPITGDVLDVGAHAGIFALWALGEWPGARVTCYEAHPALADIARRNLDGLPATVVERAVIGSADVAACVDPDGMATLYEGRRTLLGTSLHKLGWQADDRRVGAQWMPAADLPACALLKVDVEGAELAILRDYRHGAHLRVLLVETHRRADFLALCQLAWSWGLEMARANPGRNGCVTSAWVRASP
jgi:FkbM family methyltransferase